MIEFNHPKPRPELSHFIHIFVLPVLGYTILSFIFFGRMVNWTRWYAGTGPDPLLFIWFLHWWPFSIVHSLNPFVSNYLWFPDGDNFTWHTSVPLAALLGAPITLLGGAVLSYNIMILMAPALSAWTSFLLARYLTCNRLAALVGGYLFGFSSYENGQMLGHLNLILTFLVPLTILLCVRRARGELERTRFVVLLTITLLAQLGLSSEILATLCVFGAVSWTVFLVCAPTTHRPGLWRLAFDIVFAALAVTILATPFLFYLAKGFPNFATEVNSATTYSADLLNYFIPTGVTRIGRTVFAPLAGQFTGNASEQGAYLSFPLIFLMALYFQPKNVNPYTRALLITTLLLVVLSFGPWFHIAGVQLRIPLPWWVIQNCPLIRSALPIRFTMYVSLCSAVVTALYLATPGISRWHLFRYILVGLSCLCLLPNSHGHAWTRWPSQPFFVPKNVNQALGTSRNVLILPFMWTGPGMAWQLDAGMQFTQSGGYTGFPPYSEMSFPALTEFLAGVAGPSFNNDLAAFCASHHVDYILNGPGTPAPLVAAIAAQGWPQRIDHGVNVVKVPLPSVLQYYYVQGYDYLPSAAALNWMGRQVRIVTHGTPTVLTLEGTGFFRQPVQVTVNFSEKSVIYSIGSSTVQKIHLSATTALTLTASQTFVPDKFLHNGDTRNLSVLISLERDHASSTTQ